jgi:tRNA(His) 5'-end guanylyltransferase
MANSKYEYVKGFELDDSLLPDCFIVVRIDGKGFTKWVSRSVARLEERPGGRHGSSDRPA